MSLGFEVGRVYSRRADVHARLGGNQQSGISYRAGGSTIFFVTGKTGENAGYEDGWREDGVFEYCGEGQVGDQTLTKGNLEIAEHSRNGKQLLMFSQVEKGLVRFDGEMVCEGYSWRRIRDRNGDWRRGIIFQLRPLDAVEETVSTVPDALPASFADLQRRAYEAAGVSEPRPGTTPRTIYERSADVKLYVLTRAKGHCEGCGQPAPFKRPDGSPYLEPHHIRRVSDGGPDHPAFVIALCPNCHRRVHAGADGAAYNANLLTAMGKIEPKIWV